MNLSNQTFKVVVVLDIWTHPREIVEEELSDIDNDPKVKVASLQKELELPFTPFIGLELVFPGWSCTPLISVVWSEEDYRFFCRVEGRYPIGKSAARNLYDMVTTYKDLLRWALEGGWTRPELGGGDAPR
jgi:hypothetical protein